MDEEDLYISLGLAGPNASVVEVRKAYRGLALLWHPDKQGGKKAADVAAAAIEFEKVRKAYEILGDEKARVAYDELWKLRKSRLEKEKGLSLKRQKMIQDLRAREKAFEAERSEKREEEVVAKRLKAELARIRDEQARRRNNPASFDFLSDLHSSTQSESGIPPKTRPASGPTPGQAMEMQNTLNTTLKVSWKCTEGGVGGYTATRLKEIFEEFGAVEDVVIRSGKVRKMGSGLVVMTSQEAATAAIDAIVGDFSNPLTVVPLVPLTTVVQPPVVEPVNVIGLSKFVGSGYLSHENEVLTKMRRATERAKLLKEIQEADLKAS